MRLFGELRRAPQLLGDLLLEAGQIDAPILRAALARRQKTGARIGNVLRDSGLVTPDALTEALSIQWGLGRIDLAASPPNADLLLSIDLAECLRIGCVPWRKLDDQIIIAVEDPFQAEAARTACGLDDQNVAIALAPSDAIRRVLETGFRPELEQAARTTCPSDMSCRELSAGRLQCLTAGALCLLATATYVHPQFVFWLLFGWIILANIVISAMRLGALIARLLPGGRPQRLQTDVPRLSSYRTLPVISLLVPLHSFYL